MERRDDCMNLSPTARIINSVASQETALACILNAECTKLHKAIGMARSIQELNALSCTLIELIEAVTQLENQLRLKLELVVNH